MFSLAGRKKEDKMSDLNFNYLVNKAIHIGGEEQKIARDVLNAKVSVENVKDLLYSPPSSGTWFSEFSERFNKITEALWDFHKSLTDNEIPY